MLSRVNAVWWIESGNDGWKGNLSVPGPACKKDPQVGRRFEYIGEPCHLCSLQPPGRIPAIFSLAQTLSSTLDASISSWAMGDVL